GYDHFVYVLPPCSACGTYDGYGDMPGSRVWILRCTWADDFAHELGHNLGMNHATADTEHDGDNDQQPDCEYCDKSDPMGYVNVGLRQVNAAHKEEMGWLPSSKVINVTGAGTYTLASLETSPASTASPQVLKIPTGVGDYYYISYRQTAGYDANLSSEYANRVNIHRAMGTPGTYTFFLQALTDGQTVPINNRMTITQVSHDASSAVVQVGFDMPPPGNWIVRHSQTSGQLNGVSFGNGTFVAVGNIPYGSYFDFQNYGLSSSDGANWISHSIGFGGDPDYGVVYGGGQFVDVGAAGDVWTAPDGANWNSGEVITSLDLRSVAYGNGRYVAVGSGGTVLTSADGISWTGTPLPAGSTPDLYAITYAGGLFVAVGAFAVPDGYSGAVFTSSDGLTWVDRSPAVASGTLRGIAYQAGTYLAVGDFGQIITSPDATHWNWQNSGTANTLYAVTAGDDWFVAVGANGTILTSSAGLVWSSSASGTSQQLYGVAFGNSGFVAVGNNQTILQSATMSPSTAFVTTLNNSGAGSLQAALASMPTGGTVLFPPGLVGTIYLTNSLIITQDLTIAGPGANLLSIDGGRNNVFEIDSGNVNLSGLTITNGGQAIRNGSHLVVNGCVIIGNISMGVNNWGTMALNNSTVCSNTCGAGGEPVGVMNTGTLGMTNCTVSGNRGLGSTSVGGIGQYGGSLTLISCTICSNSVLSIPGSYYGGLWTSGGTTTLGNTLIANNTGRKPFGSKVWANDVEGTFNSLGYNLIGQTNGSIGWAATDLTGSSAAPLDPKLGLFQNNGSQTPTHALLAGSLAIDNGQSFGVTKDARGWPRPYDNLSVPNAAGGDGSDIGAYELVQPVLSITSFGPYVVLSWPSSPPFFGGFSVQTANDLGAQAVWAPLPEAATLNGNQYQVIWPRSQPKQFFRLVGQ
ncbi:MAG: hypothetical protein C5B50_00075, partial [Verrucomicrobia bacterium]